MRKLFWFTYIATGLLISFRYYNKNLELFPAIISLYSLLGFGIYTLDKEMLSLKSSKNKKQSRKKKKK